MMTFEDFLVSTRLPSTAKDQLPDVLSEDTKKELLKSDEAEKILFLAIDEVNAGSIERIETLVKRRLKS